MSGVRIHHAALTALTVVVSLGGLGLPVARAAVAAAGRADRPSGPGSSSVLLGELPDGAEKRSFILDCTGCHQLDSALAFPGGQARTEAEWKASVEKMLSFAGPRSRFPVIGERDPAATAAWLARHLAAPPASGNARAASPAVVEYDYPYPRDLPHDLRVDGAGRVVITGMMTHRMLVLDPATGAYDEVEIPVPGANPRAVDIDEAGDWWVLLGGPAKVARYRPADAAWSTYDIGVYPHSVRNADGRVWYNGHFTSRPPVMGYVDAADGSVHTFDVTLDPAPEVAAPIPYGLRVAPDGTVWATELRGNRLVRLDPATGTTEAWLLPTPTAGPRRLDVGPDGTVWIPAYAAGSLFRFDPGGGEFTEYPLPWKDALPYVARVDGRRGTVWIGTGAADALFAFDPESEQFTVHGLPTEGALVRHIDVDPRTGEVWAAYGAAPGIPPKIARITPGAP